MKKAFTKSILILICIYISICSFSLGGCFLCSHKETIWFVNKRETCYEVGIKDKVCIYCRAVLDTKVIPKKIHKIEWIVVEDSTCDETGLKKKMCNNCRTVEDTEEIPKKTHKEEWMVIVDCTDTKRGHCARKCKNCTSGGLYVSSTILYYTLNEDGNSYTADFWGEFKEDDCFIQPTYKGLTVTDIADGLLYGKESLYRLTIPNSVIRIGAEAFRHCNNLRYVYFLENSKLEIIDVGAFDSCTSLETMIIPNSVLSINDYAFSCCNIKNIIIPKNVINLGKNVFAGCTGLTDIYCEAQEKPEGWNDLWNNDCSATVHWGYVGQN